MTGPNSVDLLVTHSDKDQTSGSTPMSEACEGGEEMNTHVGGLGKCPDHRLRILNRRNFF